jgi:hypothetical protein
LRSLWKIAFVDHGGLRLRAAINWLQSFLPTPAIYYLVR